MKSVAFGWMVFFSVAALAGQKMIDCVDKGDQRSWSVSLKPDLTLANFFNNDNDVALKRTKINVYETFPPIVEIEYEGKDRKSAIKFTYDQNTRKGTLEANVGAVEEFQVEFECKQVKDSINWQAVQKAIDDAKKNGGSTRLK